MDTLTFPIEKNSTGDIAFLNFDKKAILRKIKKTIKSIAPNATIILYGSYARGEEKSKSDIDLLILLDKEKISWKEEKKITYPLYDIEFDTGKIISPLVMSKNTWNSRRFVTPFYENIVNDGLVL